MNTLREYTEYTMHEDELASDHNLDKIYRYLCTNQKLLQST